MTRTEEIIKAADEASDKEEYLDGWERNRCREYFTQGAEWADKTMLDKICGYLLKLKRCNLTSKAGLFYMKVFSEEDIKQLRKSVEK